MKVDGWDGVAGLVGLWYHRTRDRVAGVPCDPDVLAEEMNVEKRQKARRKIEVCVCGNSRRMHSRRIGSSEKNLVCYGRGCKCENFVPHPQPEAA